MPTLKQKKARINAWLSANFWPEYVTRQATFFALRGRYFQGRYTHSADVDDVETACDRLDDVKHDQVESWRDFMGDLLAGIALPCRFISHAYEGPDGHGCWVEVYVRNRGKIYTRSKGIGPEDHDAAWHVYEVPDMEAG